MALFRENIVKKRTAHLNWKFPPEYYTRSFIALNTALSKIAAYRHWNKLDPGENFPIDQRFAALPSLTKKDIRDNFPQRLLPAGTDLESAIASGEIELVNTSGTTEDGVINIWNQKWWDASEQASWKLNSYTAKVMTGEHQEAILANPLNVGIISNNVNLSFEKRRLARFLYLNEKTDPTQWTGSLMQRMVDEINSFKPKTLEANPSLLARLSRFISSNNLRVYQPDIITFTYEYNTITHLRQINKAFIGPFSSSYGTTETGYVFMQCEAGNFHQNIDFCRVDFQPLKPEQGGPLLGKILVTPFDNPWNYFIRFDTGDLATLEASGVCPCGRNSGVILSSLNGRWANLTLTRDGRLITLSELDQRMSNLEGVEEYKLIQKDEMTYEILLVCSEEKRIKLIRETKNILKNLYGKDAVVIVILGHDITLERSGKYLISKALFPIDQKIYLDTVFPQ